MLRPLTWPCASEIFSYSWQAKLDDLPFLGRHAISAAADLSSIDRLRETLRENLGPPLKTLHHPIDLWLGDLPMWVATACVLGLYGATIAWVWTLRRDYVFRGAPDRRPWRDLRIWATVVVMPYVAVYLWLGR